MTSQPQWHQKKESFLIKEKKRKKKKDKWNNVEPVGEFFFFFSLCEKSQQSVSRSAKEKLLSEGFWVNFNINRHGFLVVALQRLSAGAYSPFLILRSVSLLDRINTCVQYFPVPLSFPWAIRPRKCVLKWPIVSQSLLLNGNVWLMESVACHSLRIFIGSRKTFKMQ
uniref:Uncharacterized protein n=1 Tax=Anguilla anguilla TaxID=7936 RepID=A0A0E9WPJ4_ANGAN